MENEKEWEKSFADKFSVMLERYTWDMDFKESQRAQDEVYTFISKLLTTEREKARKEAAAKVACLVGYLEATQRGEMLGFEVAGVIIEANEWLATLSQHSDITNK